MSESKTGAIVRFCGHAGVFKADIYLVAGANVVRASAPLTPDDLYRDQGSLDAATHHLVDYPHAGFWRQDLGVFVVPEDQCTKLKH